MSDKEELQRKLIQYQLLQANLHALQEREEVISKKFTELQETKETLDELKTVENGDEVMIPLGNGNFIPGKILDTKNVLVGLGAGVVVMKSREKAKEILEKRIKETYEILQNLSLQIQKVSQEIQKLQPEIEKLTKEEG